LLIELLVSGGQSCITQAASNGYGKPIPLHNFRSCQLVVKRPRMMKMVHPRGVLNDMSNLLRRRPVGAPSLLNDSRHPSRPVGSPQHRIRMGRPRRHGDEGSGGSISLGVPTDFEVPALVSIA
jgi:hypothetical protein